MKYHPVHSSNWCICTPVSSYQREYIERITYSLWLITESSHCGRLVATAIFIWFIQGYTRHVCFIWLYGGHCFTHLLISIPLVPNRPPHRLWFTSVSLVHWNTHLLISLSLASISLMHNPSFLICMSLVHNRPSRLWFTAFPLVHWNTLLLIGILPAPMRSSLLMPNVSVVVNGYILVSTIERKTLPFAGIRKNSRPIIISNSLLSPCCNAASDGTLGRQYLGDGLPIRNFSVEFLPYWDTVFAKTELRHYAGDSPLWKARRLRTVTN